MSNFIALQSFLFLSFCFSTIKGAMRGWKSELISFVSGVCGVFAAFGVYRPGVKYFVTSAMVFSLIYLFGLFKSSKYKNKGVFDMIFGMIIGAIKFVIVISILLAIGIAFDVVPKHFLDNGILKHLTPLANWMHHSFVTYFLSK